MRFKLVLGVVLLLVTLAFIVQNSGVVDIRFLGWQFSMSLALVIFGALATGAFGGWALTGALRLKRKAGSH